MRRESALMIDIETMGINERASIVAIGACVFDPYKDIDVEHDNNSTFYTTVSLKSNVKVGREIDPNTVEWWLKQSAQAQQALFDEPHTNLRQALVTFRMWAQEQTPKINTIWANDPDFDVVILRNACESVGELWPYPFWMNRSVRTIKHYAWPNDEPQFNRVGTYHRAVDDAIHQAHIVQLGLARIRNGKTSDV